ncbi:hypothetical protein FPQ18DRAFT_6510 [Pyronema domesticum]|nr:hypothetical protein FPQ18DRAFT_6510 [Pyronema domesticum]
MVSIRDCPVCFGILGVIVAMRLGTFTRVFFTHFLNDDFPLPMTSICPSLTAKTRTGRTDLYSYCHLFLHHCFNQLLTVSKDIESFCICQITNNLDRHC